MNKRIIPAEASFFVPVEKVLFDHSRMRRSLETAAAENYPALTEDIMWDYTLFAFEKKQWALISITDRSTYGEECIRHSSRSNNEYVLYSYGEPVAMFADGNASYFGTDILGSVRNVTDKYGVVQSSYDYDAFGSPYLSNDFDIGASFGYCGKVFDSATGLYDYGFRDYSPNNARFTTIDPIRDGSNWFAYVVNDPVNYCDPLGLTASDSKWINNGDGTYTAKPGATLWGLQQETGENWQNFGFDRSPETLQVGETITVYGATSKATQVQATPKGDTAQALTVPHTSNQAQNSNSNTKSIISDFIKIGLGFSEVVTGCTISSTGPIGGVAGTLMIIDGLGRIGLGFTSLVADLAENSGKKTSLQGKNVPASIGGMIGAAIDKKNNQCFSDTGNIGFAQKNGEKINAIITYSTGSYTYVNNVKNAPETISTAKEALSVISNEASHIYDTVDTTTTVLKN